MKTEILLKTKEQITVAWSDENLGFGRLDMKWQGNHFILDSEHLGIENTIKIIKSIDFQEKKIDVYSNEKCVFNYCPNPDLCKKNKNGCIHI